MKALLALHLLLPTFPEGNIGSSAPPGLFLLLALDTSPAPGVMQCSCWVPLGVFVPLKCPHPLSEGADRAGMRTEVLSEFPTSRSPLPSPFHLCDLFGCIAGQTDSFVSFSLFCSWGCWFPIPGAAHPSDSSGPSSVSPVWSSADQEWGASCSCSASAALQKCFPLNLFHNYFPFIIFFLSVVYSQCLLDLSLLGSSRENMSWFLLEREWAASNLPVWVDYLVLLLLISCTVLKNDCGLGWLFFFPPEC